MQLEKAMHNFSECLREKNNILTNRLSHKDICISRKAISPPPPDFRPHLRSLPARGKRAVDNRPCIPVLPVEHPNTDRLSKVHRRRGGYQPPAPPQEPGPQWRKASVRFAASSLFKGAKQEHAQTTRPLSQKGAAQRAGGFPPAGSSASAETLPKERHRTSLEKGGVAAAGGDGGSPLRPPFYQTPAHKPSPVALAAWCIPNPPPPNPRKFSPPCQNFHGISPPV